LQSYIYGAKCAIGAVRHPRKPGNQKRHGGDEKIQRPGTKRINDMLDLAYAAIVLIFFWISLLYVRTAEKL